MEVDNYGLIRKGLCFGKAKTPLGVVGGWQKLIPYPDEGPKSLKSIHKSRSCTGCFLVEGPHGPADCGHVGREGVGTSYNLEGDFSTHAALQARGAGKV